MTMQARISKEFKFEAAHRLLNHDGNCQRPHGHSYRVIVEVAGRIKPADGAPDEGMVLDFGVLKDAWMMIEPELDHRDLNETLGPRIGPTTAENIAVWLLDKFDAAVSLAVGDRVTAVTVYETATSSATVRP